MGESLDHAQAVDAWLERRAKGAAGEQLVGLFNEASTGLWVRSRTTLGEVTLTAIAERVVLVAVEHHPVLSGLVVDAAMGIHWPQPRVNATGSADRELTPGIRFVLVELLSVLGNLTADILTEELHAELLGVAVSSTRPPRGRSERGTGTMAAKRTAGGKKRRS